MIRSDIDILHSGNIISLRPSIVEGDDELQYRTMHSLSGSTLGMIDTNRIDGMQYEQARGYTSNLSKTSIVRSVIIDSVFRLPLIKYIQKYVYADNASIFRAIGRDNTDDIVVSNLSRMKRRGMSSQDRINSRVYTVTNFLSRIPHIPIVDYLDYGTGDGSVAKAIGDTIGANTYGVDVFPMDRPIDTIVVNSGDSLPSSWTNKFQLITAFAVLHHVKDQQHIIDELYRVLQPGGILILREHDYIDMVPIAVLKKQYAHIDDLQGVVSNIDMMSYPHSVINIGRDPYRNFIDAIHIVSMSFTDEPPFWSLYRSRMEWHCMLQSIGFDHMCTSMIGSPTVSSLMSNRINPNTDWINTNPQRLYEAVYRKTPLPTQSLILEYRIDRSNSIDNVFPRIGGKNGMKPSVRYGTNYDDEVLAYMTPWYHAQQTSIIISRLVRSMYLSDKAKKFSLYDGTGGGGGNTIAFMSNPDIGTINVYERIGKFYTYIVNNLSLYSTNKPTKIRDGMKIVDDNNTVYIHNTEMDINTINLSGSVLYLDVPWISSGCGYKLYGYKYNNMSLEKLAILAIEKGAYMVVLKLPPRYNLRIKHDVESIDSMSLYIIHRRYIPRSDTSNIVAKEMIRYRLLDNIRRQYRSLFPNRGKDAFYIWLYEMITRGIDDPLIPITRQPYVPSMETMIDTYWPSMPFEQLSILIKDKYPNLMDQLKGVLFMNKDSITSLKMSVAIEASLRDDDNIIGKYSILYDTIKHTYDMFVRLSSTHGIDVSISINKYGIIVNPNSQLRSVLSSIDTELKYTYQYPQCTGTKGYMCIPILSDKINTLKKRYTGSSFNTDITLMCMRYGSMMETTGSYSGVNLHAALPVPVFSSINRMLSVSTECFASPLNATLDRYMSVFPDTDTVFGSIGSFFSYAFNEDGSYEANPPFTSFMIQSMIDRINGILSSTNKALSFIIVVPNWNDKAINTIKQSQWKVYDTILESSRHSYIAGQQHISNTSFESTSDTYVAILQSTSGRDKYPIGQDIGIVLSSSFK